MNPQRTADGLAQPGSAQGRRQAAAPSADQAPGLPSLGSVSLPKGGGAFRGIGEKFSVSPTTGTSTLVVPVPASPGRSGFGPDLALSYDSGSGNGAFGLGWSLSLPSISRKTDKGVPRYHDDDDDDAEADVFILSGSEDLVPVLVEGDDGWRRVRRHRMVDDVAYVVESFRPRVEGRSRGSSSGPTPRPAWPSGGRSRAATSRPGTAAPRTAACPIRTTRPATFQWLACRTRDAHGNALCFRYKQENGDGVDLDAPHERGRTPATRSANRYLKRVRYGNRVPDPIHDPRPSTDDDAGEWMFEIVLDYGEHDRDTPAPTEQTEWLVRRDPFSTNRAGFEIRTYRLCQRLLMFHHFPAEVGVGDECLVGSLDLSYGGGVDAATRRVGDRVVSSIVSLRAVRLPAPARRVACAGSIPAAGARVRAGGRHHEVHELDPGSLENLPAGVGDDGYRWSTWTARALRASCAEQGGAWSTSANLGEGRFGPMQQVRERSRRPLRSDRERRS